jgi:PPOX class probable F420-dependent enzyme
VNADEVREFLKTNHRAVLATRRRDGGVQLSPVLVVADAEGRVVISSRETALKVKNLRRDPYASLCIMNDRFWGPWAQAEGPVTIVSLPEAMDGLIDYYRRASGEHPDWDDYRAAMERDRRVLVRMTIERAGPNVEG